MQTPPVKMEAPKVEEPEKSPLMSKLLIAIFWLLAFLVGAIVMLVLMKLK